MIDLHNADVYATNESITTSTRHEGQLRLEAEEIMPRFNKIDHLYNMQPNFSNDRIQQQIIGMDRNKIILEPSDSWAVPLMGYEPNLRYKRIRGTGNLHSILPFVELKSTEKGDMIGHQRNEFGDIMTYIPLGMGQTPTRIDTTVSPIGISQTTEMELNAPFWYNNQYQWGFNNFALQ